MKKDSKGKGSRARRARRGVGMVDRKLVEQKHHYLGDPELGSPDRNVRTLERIQWKMLSDMILVL